jgi:hypothetical protein
MIQRLQDAARELSYLRKREYCGHPDPLGGMCYIVSEALFHLEPGKYKPVNVKHEGAQHWWLQDRETGAIVDVTASQFETPVPYEKGVGRGFLTKEPSRRARIIMEAVQ